jgi:DNA-binding transcriptional LysR family regulator
MIFDILIITDTYDCMTNTLDLDAVRAFILTADLSSFTRAADRLQTSQAAVSMKVQRLEMQLRRRLLERTPRHVSLSVDGTAFLPVARELLHLQDRAMASVEVPTRSLAIGISQHLVGAQIPKLLVQLHRYDPSLRIDIRVAGSGQLLQQLRNVDVDAAIVLQEERQRGGKILYVEQFAWMGVPHWTLDTTHPLPISTQGKTCSLRNAAIALLDNAHVEWNEVFIGQGAACVGAAAAAGLAVAVLAERAAPAETVDLTHKLKLPSLPARRVALHSTLRDRRSREALDIVAVALQRHCA